MAEVTPERYPISVAVAPATLVVFAVIASACTVLIPDFAVFAVIASVCAVLIPVLAVFAATSVLLKPRLRYIQLSKYLQ